MRKFFVLGSFLFALVFPSLAFSAGVAGKTIRYTNSHGQTYWTTYRVDGTTESKSTRTHGQPGFIYDTGHWEYRGGRLCERYDTWQKGRGEFCRDKK